MKKGLITKMRFRFYYFPTLPETNEINVFAIDVNIDNSSNRILNVIFAVIDGGAPMTNLLGADDKSFGRR